MSRLKHRRKRLSSFQMILLGFAGVIVLGALILMLPISSAQGVVTSFDKTLFTSVSAVCVTGLVVVDTGSYWSIFGQAIIIMLIQIGGLGVITFAASLSTLCANIVPCQEAYSAYRNQKHNSYINKRIRGIIGQGSKFIVFRSQNVKACVTKRRNRMKERIPNSFKSEILAKSRHH